MHTELIELENKFQTYLKKNHYSFIGPFDENLLKVQVHYAKKFTQRNFYNFSIHNVLSNRDAMDKGLMYLQDSIEKRVYIILNEDRRLCIKLNIDDYCKLYNIDFKI